MSVDQTVGAGRLVGNSRYANPAGNFAKRAFRHLPGLRWLATGTLAACAVMIVAGAFGTWALPLPTRIAFWTLLFGWSAIKWQAWFALLVRRPADWWRAAAIGALALNVTLPYEIELALALVGVEASVRSVPVWLAALALSAVLYAVLLVAHRSMRRAPSAPPAPAIRPDGLLERAGLRSPDGLLAIVAEDHYCRVHAAGGNGALVYFRFGDALEEVAALDGCRVHRGAWVADAAVLVARRFGRRWLVQLTNGCTIPVSARYVAELRRRGWHRRAISGSRSA